MGITKARKRCSELLKTILGIICLGRQAAQMILLMFWKILCSFNHRLLGYFGFEDREAGADAKGGAGVVAVHVAIVADIPEVGVVGHNG